MQTRQDMQEALATLRKERDAAEKRGRWLDAMHLDKAVRAAARALDAAYPPDTTPGPVALGGRLP